MNLTVEKELELARIRIDQLRKERNKLRTQLAGIAAVLTKVSSAIVKDEVISTLNVRVRTQRR